VTLVFAAKKVQDFQRPEKLNARATVQESANALCNIQELSLPSVGIVRYPKSRVFWPPFGFSPEGSKTSILLSGSARTGGLPPAITIAGSFPGGSPQNHLPPFTTCALQLGKVMGAVTSPLSCVLQSHNFKEVMRFLARSPALLTRTFWLSTRLHRAVICHNSHIS
jgi:hypothetical protein